MAAHTSDGRAEDGAGTWLTAVPGWGAIVAIVAALIAFVALTNRWMSFSAGIRYAHGDDEYAYLKLAHAFPGFPDERIADQHAQRWAVHWVVGGLADLAGAAPEDVYRVCAAALVVALMLVAATVLRRIGASTAIALVALGAVALNPYALRYYGLEPAYLADLLFDLSMGLLLLGMATRRLWLVLGALLLAAIGRQTVVAVAPVVALWLAIAPEWRDRPGPAVTVGGARRPLLPAAAALLVPLVAYLAVKGAASGFSRAGVPLTRLTILEAVGDLPATAGDLANHFAHVLNALLAVAALLAATLWTARRRLAQLPSLFWGSLAVGTAIVLLAAALNPDPVFNDYSSTNEPRLVALGLVPFAIAFGSGRRWLERETGARPLASSPALVAALVALLALGSLHHIYTSVSTGSKEATLALELLTAATLLVLLVRWDRPGAGERGERRASPLAAPSPNA